ncbi:hypothetical protein [Desulfonatronum parangueonense]
MNSPSINPKERPRERIARFMDRFEADAFKQEVLGEMGEAVQCKSQEGHELLRKIALGCSG